MQIGRGQEYSRGRQTGQALSRGLAHHPWGALGRGAGGLAASLFINLLLFSAALWLLGPTPGRLTPGNRIMIQMDTTRRAPVAQEAPGPRTESLPPKFTDELVPDFEAKPSTPPERAAGHNTVRAKGIETTPVKLKPQTREKTQTVAGPGNEAETAEPPTGRAGSAQSAPLSIPTVGSAAGSGPITGPFDMGQVDHVPRITARPSPAYPRSARRRGVQGWVKVRFMVDRHGMPGQARVLESLPPGVFDDSVLKILPRWRFEPGIKSGQAVDTWVVTTVRFQLTD